MSRESRFIRLADPAEIFVALSEISTDILKDELDSRLDNDFLKSCALKIDQKKEIAEAIKGGDRTYLRIVLDRWMPGLGDMI